jgi:hypothetical protein
MNNRIKPPFTSSYNAGRSLLLISIYPPVVQFTIINAEYIYTCLALILVFASIRSDYSKFLWQETEWYRDYILIIYAGQLPFFINALIFDAETFLAIEMIASYIVFLYYRGKLEDIIEKYEIPD